MNLMSNTGKKKKKDLESRIDHERGQTVERIRKECEGQFLITDSSINTCTYWLSIILLEQTEER